MYLSRGPVHKSNETVCSRFKTRAWRTLLDKLGRQINFSQTNARTTWDWKCLNSLKAFITYVFIYVNTNSLNTAGKYGLKVLYMIP